MEGLQTIENETIIQANNIPLFSRISYYYFYFIDIKVGQFIIESKQNECGYCPGEKLWWERIFLTGDCIKSHKSLTIL